MLFDAFEPGLQQDAGHPALTDVLADLPFVDGDRRGMGLVAVQRFTGRGFTADDLAGIEAADVAYRIGP